MCDEKISFELPNDNLKKALNNIVKNNLKYDKFTVNIERGSNRGDNYIGIVYRTTITCLDDDCEQNNNAKLIKTGKKVKKFSIIIKIPPQNSFRREKFFARPCFLREALVYDENLPLFINFQESKGIILGEGGFYEVPECIATLTDDGFEGIFLRDLRDEHFTMFDRLKDIDFNHAKLVLSALGRLHALSFAFKDQNPKAIKSYTTMKDILADRDTDDDLVDYFNVLKKRATDLLDPKTESSYFEKIENVFGGETFLNVLQHLVKGQVAEPHAVICHGDCWNNNVLFRYENGHPVECRLIDWQIARYASPACDITYYIFCCTTKELREQHYEDLLNVYYDEFSKLLSRLGSDPQKLFSKKNLHEQLKKFGRFGLLMAIMLLPMLTTYAEDIPDLDELSEQMRNGDLNIEEQFKSVNTVELYNKRMRDVIYDLTSYGYM